MRNKITNENFAVKGFSKKYLGTKKNGQNTLMSEIEMLRNLDHPNIIKLEEVYETENSVYVVQELCEGGSLLEGRTKLLNSEQAKIVLTQILAVIQYLSSKGIVHRDLKPYNILRKFKACDDVDNQLKIIDFGLVYNPRSRVDTSGKKCGTPGYIAPEILNHQKKGNSFDEEDKPSFDHITHEPELKLDGKVDVFSVGVIFYYMMTGVFPFDGISSKEVYDSNKKGNINFDIPEAKKVEPSAWDLVTKMLEIDPKLRLGPEEALNHPFLRVEQEDKVIQAEDMEIPNEWDVVDSDECNSRNDIPLFRSKMFKGGDNISRMVCAQGSKTSSGARSLLSVKMQLGKKMNASPHQSPNFSISSPLMSRRSNQARNRPSVLSRYTSNSSKSSRMKSSRACSRSSGSNGNIEESTKDSIKTQNVNYIQSKVVKASGQFTKSIFSTKK
jgi:serine/threonine protein kinase